MNTNRLRHASVLAALTLLGAAALFACGPAVEPATPDRIGQLPETERLVLPGLQAPVDVVRDDLGIPHIYATNLRDAAMVEGFVQARDRLVQMDLLRRTASGRLAAFGGALSPSLVDSDIFMRTLGLHRVAQRNWEALVPGSEQAEALQGFADGVNAFRARLLERTEVLPSAYATAFPPEVIDQWTPVDTLTIGRFQQWSLSWDLQDELDLDQSYRSLLATFDASNPNPALAARAGAVRDLLRLTPADPTTTRTGFPMGEGQAIVAGTGRRPLVPQALLRQALGFAALREQLPRFHSEDHRASNNWIVSGAHTASGAPMLANDPHLALISPAIFHQVGLDLSRGGGANPVQAAGIAFPGIPGIVLGFTDAIAWGGTVAVADALDVYLETVTGTAASGAATVRFNGTDVPIEYITETIDLGTGSSYDLVIEWVPHHGPIVPAIVGHRAVPRTALTALSWRWAGFDPSNDLQAFLGLLRARNVDDAETALDDFKVGAQNWVIVDREGNLFWTTTSTVPIRDARAFGWDPVTNPLGPSPCFVLPGTGEAEWVGVMAETDIPHERNPARGFIATANADPVGVTLDGNPFNDGHYFGCAFDLGFRVGRITDRLNQLTARGGVTLEDIEDVQADTFSNLGRRMRGFLIDAVQAAREEMATAGTHPDLSAVVTEAGARFPLLEQASDRLSAWGLQTPPAVEGTPAISEIADSVATTIFNAWLVRFQSLVLDDEFRAASISPGSDPRVRALLFLLESPTEAATYDATRGDSLIFDDLDTPVAESRSERIVRALLMAVEHLEAIHGSSLDQWRWGRHHAVRFRAIVPAIVGADLSVPIGSDPTFPLGFPRAGDNFVVDVANPGVTDDDYTYGSGPTQRLVVEMFPSGPRARNVIPGGEIFDPGSPHFRDQADAWRTNQNFPVAFTMDEVVARARSRIHFTP